jgi:hypothetical protein
MSYIVKTLRDNVALPNDEFYRYAESTARLTDAEFAMIDAADIGVLVEVVTYEPGGGGGTPGAVTSVFGRTGDVVGAKADVGLANVNNTSDAAKPVSTATQTALDGKQTLDTDLTTIAGLTATTDSILQSKASAWTTRTPAQLKTDLVLVKGDVGLGNVDNTSDANKPVSTAASTALASKQPLDSDLTTIAGLTATTDTILQSKAGAWTTRTPAQVKTDLVLVKGDVGLGNVDNTSDANKPISTATQTALDAKAAKHRVVQAYISTQGRITLQNTAGVWAPLTGWPTLSIAAAVGDYIDVTFTGLKKPEQARIDVGVLVSGAFVRYLSSGQSTPAFDGDVGWQLPGGAFFGRPGPSGFTVVSGDLDSGNVVLAVAVNDAGTSTLDGSTNYPFFWRAMNFGPVF